MDIATLWSIAWVVFFAFGSLAIAATLIKLLWQAFEDVGF
jgi:hypothetical protein